MQLGAGIQLRIQIYKKTIVNFQLGHLRCVEEPACAYMIRPVQVILLNAVRQLLLSS